MPYVLKNTRRIKVHRPRMKPSGGCQSFCFGFCSGGGIKEGGGGRLQVSNGGYISPVAATADCPVNHAGRQAQNNTHSIYLFKRLTRPPIAVSHTNTQKSEGWGSSATSPPPCVALIHCHIITLCMIILLNLACIKHASHKEHIYMLMLRQYSVERWDLTSKNSCESFWRQQSRGRPARDALETLLWSLTTKPAIIQ